jgi:hypothetical protein
MTNFDDIPPRPDEYDPAAARKVAAELLPDFKIWLEKNQEPDVSIPDEQLLQDLIDAIHRRDDGFSIAQRLHELGYDSDARLVDIVDAAGHLRHRIGLDLYRKWVKENSIRSPFKVGDRVIVRRRGSEGKLTGEITNVDHELGRSTVFCEKEGHVRSGVGIHGVLVLWENLEGAPERCLARVERDGEPSFHVELLHGDEHFDPWCLKDLPCPDHCRHDDQKGLTLPFGPNEERRCLNCDQLVSRLKG